jgi:tetraacyldisaccharide 4'-kinase
MRDDAALRDILSGQRTDIPASFIRAALSVPAAMYALAVGFRNRLFDWRIRTSYRPPVPVVSVGNLTVGGTGKSPFVSWLVAWLRARGKKPAVLSRGYGALAGRLNDEALELQQRFPDVIQLQARNRIGQAHRAVTELGADVLILDDGFQHRQIARDCDILLIDATQPFGFEKLLPRGLLREPLPGIRRAGAVVLTRIDQVTADQRLAIRDVVRRHNPNAILIESAFRPHDLIDARGEARPLATIRDAAVFGFCGIGNPENFQRSLESLDCRLVGFKKFPDHHRYTAADATSMQSLARTADATMLICTSKDLVKWRRLADPGIPVWALQIQLEFISGQAALEKLLTSAKTQ